MSEQIRVRSTSEPTRCPYCHDDAGTVVCPSCSSRSHMACIVEHRGRCFCGHAEPEWAEVVRPAGPQGPPEVPSVGIDELGSAIRAKVANEINNAFAGFFDHDRQVRHVGRREVRVEDMAREAMQGARETVQDAKRQLREAHDEIRARVKEVAQDAPKRKNEPSKQQLGEGQFVLFLCGFGVFLMVVVAAIVTAITPFFVRLFGR